MSELPLFDRHEGEQARDEAIDRVERNADAAWKAAALAAIQQVAQEYPTFTSDEVWTKVPAPREPRAMGAMMRRAVALRWIEPTETFVPAAKVSQHRRPIRVWKSLICGGLA